MPPFQVPTRRQVGAGAGGCGPAGRQVEMRLAGRQRLDLAAGRLQSSSRRRASVAAGGGRHTETGIDAPPAGIAAQGRGVAAVGRLDLVRG